MTDHQKSNVYAAAQFVLIAIFAIVFFFAPGARLFAPQTIAGNVLCVAGLALVAVAFVYLRKVIQVPPEPKAGGYLVTSGVYARLRHPIYTGIVLLLIGVFLRNPRVFVAIGAVVIVAFLIVKSRFEEKLLRERYSDYAEYMKHTSGVIPGI